MFERFTDRARRVLMFAQEEARLFDHNFIGSEHLLLGLIHEGEGVAFKALEAVGVHLEPSRKIIEEVTGPGTGPPTGSPPFTPRAKKILEYSLREALQLGHNYIGTEHILLGIVRYGEGLAVDILQKQGADLNRTRQAVIQLLSGYERPPKPKESKEPKEPEPGGPSPSAVTAMQARFRYPTPTPAQYEILSKLRDGFALLGAALSESVPEPHLEKALDCLTVALSWATRGVLDT